MREPFPPLPKSLKGALHDYKVERPVRIDPQDSAGEHCSTVLPQTIKVNADLTPNWAWQTFYHELLHVVEEEQHLELTEDVVERLALGLFALWRRNGWVLPGAPRAPKSR